MKKCPDGTAHHIIDVPSHLDYCPAM